MLYAIALLLIFFVLIYALKGKPSAASRAAPFVAAAVMNSTEREVYRRLRILAPSVSVFPQVALSQVLNCKDFARRSTVKQLVADFALCDRECRVFCVLEIDGPRHDAPTQKARDMKKDAALREAGIRVVRISARMAPSDAVLLDAANLNWRANELP